MAPETLALMQKKVASGEVDALVPERVWKEWERALTELRPDVFIFSVLEACGAFDRLFPSTLRAGLPALRRAAVRSDDPVIRFAVVLHRSSQKERKELVQRYRVPMKYQALPSWLQNMFII